MVLLRFLFINSFAFLLIIVGSAIFFIPTEIFFIILKYAIAIGCVGSSINIFVKWKIKKRIMEILILRNRNEIRPETFTKYRGVLCWELVYYYVLCQLRKTEKYSKLSKEKWRELKEKKFGNILP